MPVWRTRPVQEQGQLTLNSWQVMELPNGDRHLVGYCVENREGRASSVVRKIDSKTLRVTTGTGRIYVLRGRPGVDSDAEYVWGRWREVNKVESWSEVTSSVWRQHLDATKSRPTIMPRNRKAVKASDREAD
jgi:hypothetical protein